MVSLDHFASVVPRLRTWRLELGPFCGVHLARAALVYGDEETMRFLPGGVRRGEEVSDMFSLFHACWKEHGMGVFALTDRGTGDFVGHCGLNFLEGGQEVELIYLVDKGRWGEGLATEAGGAALAYGFEILELETVCAVIMPGNTGSMKVAEKLGMRVVGRRLCYGRRLFYYRMERQDFARLTPLTLA